MYAGLLGGSDNLLSQSDIALDEFGLGGAVDACKMNNDSRPADLVVQCTPVSLVDDGIRVIGGGAQACAEVPTQEAGAPRYQEVHVLMLAVRITDGGPGFARGDSVARYVPWRYALALPFAVKESDLGVREQEAAHYRGNRIVW